MKKIYILLTMALFSIITVNAKTVEMKLWPDGAPSKNGLEGTKEFVSGTQTCSVSEPTLTVYPASKPNGKIIIACPGGGYMGLCMNKEGSDFAQWLNMQGISLAVLKYRMPNSHKEVPHDDVAQAIKLVRNRASEWGVNPQKVGVMGFSAGGHLAASAATLWRDKSERPDFQILFYPVISMEKGVTHQGSRDALLGKHPSAQTVRDYSLANRVNTRTPPAFVLLSADDDIVPIKNSMDYFTALRANNVPATMHIYPTGGHGWGYGDWLPYKDSWRHDLEQFLRNL